MVKGLRSKQIKLPSGCQSPLTNISSVHNVHCSCLTFGPECNVGLTDSVLCICRPAAPVYVGPSQGVGHSKSQSEAVI